MTDGNLNPRQGQYPVQLAEGHGFPAERIRQLIKNALDPIPTDPIPKSILLYNIVIKQVGPNNLEISCEVHYDF